MPTLLLIDDEPVIRHAFRRAFHLPEYETLTARTAAEGLELLAGRRPDAVVLDVHLPDADRLQAFDRIKAQDTRVPVVLITGHGTTDLAIEAMKRGAFDYLLKPLRYDDLRPVVERACASGRLMTVPAVIPGDPAADRADVLVGRCPAMQEVYKAIGRVASQDVTVLILGESGTGKELVARAIYQHSKRADKPLLAINCAAIPESLLESELFGHEKGAFTGADRQRVGKFEQCNGGTIFLDEVGDMTPLTQTKILRLLQDQAFERVGGSQTIRTDVRLIAATNADPEKLVTEGRFRQDLFFRLNVFPIRLPPLRERGEDIELLTDHYLARLSRELGLPLPVISPATRSFFLSYPWPGNVRELQSVLKSALLRTGGSVLTPETVSVPTLLAARPAANPTGSWDEFVNERLRSASTDVYAEAVSALDRELLPRVMAHTGGNLMRAAQLLGITRSTLRNKLRAMGAAGPAQ
jgi:DNA-binding NtrC family response regulator